MNLYRGQLEAREVFPYPNALNADQKDTAQMLIDPIEKYFTVSFIFKYYVVVNNLYIKS